MKNAPLVHLVIAGVVALALLGGYVVWLNVVERQRTELATLQSEIAQKDAERTRSFTARSAESDLAETEAFIASHIVQKDNIVSFLEALENTGTAYGAQVDVASLSGDDAASAGRISLSLSITGSFDAVMRTLGAIEHGSYANMVKNITLDTAGADDVWSATGVFVVATDTRP
jgi:Tfp pilus assembly protein PilN